MNIELVKFYIDLYKKNFEGIHNQEIYKWKAIKQFKDNFDIDSNDFHANLELSLAKSSNLLDSGQYYPKKMLLESIKESPDEIRDLFHMLYDEDSNILERVQNFKKYFESLIDKSSSFKKKYYQDHRAIIVYLTLMYPERYFLYKFGVFKKFAKTIDYTHKPIKGYDGNISQFQNLCELIRFEIVKDQELLNLHESRLDSSCYRDTNYNILTQDFIYAVTQHFKDTTYSILTTPDIIEEKQVLSNSLVTKIEDISFTPSIVNHIHNNIEKKRIGDLGELWVVEEEKKYLHRNGKNKLAQKVEHVAKSKGDGFGYDILSYELDGTPKYIEVKATKGNKNSTFYVTRNELEKSIIEKNRYFLYRVYEYDEKSHKGKVLKVKGDLTNICKTPVNYKVTLLE